MTGLPSLLVFAKEPAPGAVKTRLAADVGAEQAAVVYRELTTLTLAHASAARDARIVGRVELWCTPDPATAWFRGLAADHRAALHGQGDGDLGARMAAALASALSRAPAALIVGTDCPVLDAGYLARACAMLRDHDAVIGPAEDGGYVLVAGNRTLPFADVRWSTPHALADTTAGFARAGLRCGTLPVAWDVDDAAGLQRFAALRPSR
ncbi:MAG: TIGR04282 family arsenosugar biosynthesis glycosyltransferase [Burkholderiales bacterium]